MLQPYSSEDGALGHHHKQNHPLPPQSYDITAVGWAQTPGAK